MTSLYSKLACKFTWFVRLGRLRATWESIVYGLHLLWKISVRPKNSRTTSSFKRHGLRLDWKAWKFTGSVTLFHLAWKGIGIGRLEESPAPSGLKLNGSVGYKRVRTLSGMKGYLHRLPWKATGPASLKWYGLHQPWKVSGLLRPEKSWPPSTLKGYGLRLPWKISDKPRRSWITSSMKRLWFCLDLKALDVARLEKSRDASGL